MGPKGPWPTRYLKKKMTQTDTKYFCKNCKTILDPSVNDAPKKPCDNCGSTSREIHLTIIEEIKVYDSVKGQIRDPKLPSRKKMRVEFFKGAELRKKDGKMIKKERLIDKRNNLYKEVIIDPETGEILHHCEEPLSEHQNRGSAKKV